jgi:hypothetical protein
MHGRECADVPRSTEHELRQRGHDPRLKENLKDRLPWEMSVGLSFHGTRSSATGRRAWQGIAITGGPGRRS